MKLKSLLYDPEEIAAVSFPKSGRTWLELMMAYIYASLSERDVSRVLKAGHRRRMKLSKQLCRPVFKFGHGYHNPDITRGIFPVEQYWRKKVLLLVRDPRDVVVSHYYHSKYRSEEFTGNLHEFIHYNNKADDNLGSLRFGVQAIINYMNAWVENRDAFGSFCMVCYEDMKKDTRTELQHIFDHFEIPIPEPLIAAAIEYGSVENMRSLERSGQLGWHGLRSSNHSGGQKVRRATIGSYQNELSQDDQTYADELINTQLNPMYSRYKTIAPDHIIG